MEVESGVDTKEVEKKEAVPLEFELAYTISNHTGPISSIKYSPNGNLLAIASTDKTISIYDTKAQVCKFVFEGHEKGINTIAWSSDSRYLASCSDDKTIRIWNCEMGNFVRIIDKISSYPTCIAYNPRGTILACSCDNHHIYFYSTFTRTMVHSIYAHSSTISSIEFNKTGNLLLSSSIDGYCRIWECESGNCLQFIRLSQQGIPIVSATFSPNDKYVLLSCVDNQLCLWCLEHNTIERVFTNHHVIQKYLCNCIFYSHSDQYAVTASENGKIVLYNIHSDSIIEIPCTDEILFSVTSSITGEIAGGSMGTTNQVYVYKPKHCIVCLKQKTKLFKELDLSSQLQFEQFLLLYPFGVHA